ncbi:hypothetical protein HJ070_22990 [Vibrio parahaemolyticus]|nr:hypothetical protein [Vibrio parahaemolyticus]
MRGFLQEGDVIELTADHKVYAEVPCHFVYANRKGDFSLTQHDVQLSGDFEYLQGKYIVIKTEMTGGGTGHGANDVYPDGHKVTCKREDGKYTVSFYQSGCFTAMIKDIEPIAKATLQWKIAE